MDKSNMIQESFSGKIGEIKRKLDSHKDLSKDWKRIKTKNKVYKNEDLDDTTYNKIEDIFYKLRNVSTFFEYRMYFKKLCEITHIPMNQSIIIKYKLNREKYRNTVYIEYSQSPQKIVISAGSCLYHKSTNHNIKELKPSFRGKSAKSYLYSAPRVYFTLKKSMPKLATDIKASNKTTTYVPSEKIRSAWIDPLVPLYSFGAVFIETVNPIKVTRLNDLKNIKESCEDDYDCNTDDEPTFASLEEFMEYYGLEFAEDEDNNSQEYTESLKEKIGQIARKKSDDGFVKNIWNKVANNINQRHVEISLNDKTETELCKNFATVSETENYGEYKKSFKWLCKFFHIPEKNVIRHIWLDKKNKIAHVKCDTESPKKIVIPNGTMLLHVSPNDSIKELTPTFRSKTKGSYLYPNKRVYFTLGKRIDDKKIGISNTKVTHYTPKENIKTAYIDPSYSDYNTGAVYVDTAFPIPVKKIKTADKNNGKEKKFNFRRESADTYENIFDSICESFKDNKITIEYAEKVNNLAYSKYIENDK